MPQRRACPLVAHSALRCPRSVRRRRSGCRPAASSAPKAGLVAAGRQVCCPTRASGQPQFIAATTIVDRAASPEMPGGPCRGRGWRTLDERIAFDETSTATRAAVADRPWWASRAALRASSPSCCKTGSAGWANAGKHVLRDATPLRPPASGHGGLVVLRSLALVLPERTWCKPRSFWPCCSGSSGSALTGASADT